MPTVNVSRRPTRIKPAPRMTYEQFLEWMDEDIYAEWVDGEVQFMSPASAKHQDISGFLSAVMRAFAEEHDAGKVLKAPFQMKLPKVRRGREPDILFVAKDHLSRLQNTYLDGPADLAIEIISPESVLRDKGEKYAEYETEGVREYWVIDHEEQRADFYVLSDENRYERQKPENGVYHAHVLPGFWLRVAWLWQQPLPFVRVILNELDTLP